MLHTLVENAVTHRNGASAGDDLVLDLRISAAPRGGRLRFVLEAPLAPGDAEARIAEGTGLRYVRARLQESYRGEWSLEAGPSEGVWRTAIELPSPGRGEA